LAGTAGSPKGLNMSATDEYSDPEKVGEWLADQMVHVEQYLERQRVKSELIESRWELAPYIAMWEITGGWVISGDLPTDYVLDETILSARESLRFFAVKFTEMAECMLAGRRYPGTTIGDPKNAEQQRELGGLLQSRAGTLMDFANDDNLWSDEPENTQETAE
jgi:hypothetical protein